MTDVSASVAGDQMEHRGTEAGATTGAGSPPDAIEVSRGEMPVSCPNVKTDASGLHPRVYIPLKTTGVPLACPYCGTRYVLTD